MARINLTLATIFTAALMAAAAFSSSLSAATKVTVAVDYGKLPLIFEPNQGQTDAPVKFLSRGRGYSLFLTESEAVLSLGGKSTLRVRLEGAAPAPMMTGLDRLPGVSNYFIGRDRAKWRTGVPHFAKVGYEGVYPGIDLVFYGTNQRQLEYDFTVAPGADPARIRLAIEGAKRLEIAKSGDLIAHLSSGEVRFKKPVIYQEANGKRRSIAGKYTLAAENRIGFEIAAYDRTKPLVIDPVLVYSTYLGGEVNETGSGIAVDANGNAVVVGLTLSLDFPATSGAVQPESSGSFEAFVAKINDTGTGLVYATYLGGKGTDFASAVAVDTAGNAYVVGSTDSPDFPTFAPNQEAIQSEIGKDPICRLAWGPRDAFVAKLDITGSDLLFSTYLGGGCGEKAYGIAVDANGNAYVTGVTRSEDFPLVDPIQDTFAGGGGPHESSGDAFVTKISTDGTSLVFSTYLGGTDIEDGWSGGIAVDGAGTSIYVTGKTSSNDFPTTLGAFDTNCGRDDDDRDCGNQTDYSATSRTVTIAAGGVLATIDVATVGDDLVEGQETFFVDITGATFAGGATVGIVDAEGVGTIFDPQEPPAVSINDVEVTEGGTASFTVRLSAPAADDVVISFNTRDGLARDGSEGSDAFVAKLIDTGGAIALGYSTYLGGSSGDRGTGVAIDGDGNAYVAGETSSADFPTTDNVFQPIPNSSTVEGNDLALVSADVFVAKINNSGSALLYSTFLGSGAQDFGRAIAVDERGFAYLGGQFWRTDFPDFTLTPFPLKDPIQAEFGGGNGDAFVVVLDLAVNDPLIDNPAEDLIFSTYLGGSGSSTEMVWAIALDGDGNIFVTGQTSSLDFPITDGASQTKLNNELTKRGRDPKDPESGRSDAFIVKIDINAVAPPSDDGGGSSSKGGGKPCNPKKKAC